jgi:hypothetical protein
MVISNNTTNCHIAFCPYTFCYSDMENGCPMDANYLKWFEEQREKNLRITKSNENN